MTILVADVGGTNARLALASAGAVDRATVRRYRGDDHASFDDVIRRYFRDQDVDRVAKVCIAVAGPVSDGAAKLTNRDWSFSEPHLADLTGATHVRLINDLIAVGYALPGLGQNTVTVVRAATAPASRNGQRLVVNAGTGFNTCAVAVLPGGGIACLEAEEGHTRLPLPIADLLAAEFGEPARQFLSVEALLAGRGLSRLYGLVRGGASLPGEEVVAAAKTGNVAAAKSCDLYATLFGLCCRELALRYMPRDGIFLAGSVISCLEGREALFDRAFVSDALMAAIPASMSVYSIGDGFAPLHGCLAALSVPA